MSFHLVIFKVSQEIMACRFRELAMFAMNFSWNVIPADKLSGEWTLKTTDLLLKGNQNRLDHLSCSVPNIASDSSRSTLSVLIVRDRPLGLGVNISDVVFHVLGSLIGFRWSHHAPASV